MRIVLALVVASITLSFAPAAMAQERDPFEPLISTDTGTGVPVDGGEAPVVVVPIPQPVDPLPVTGGEPTGYVGLAYLLIVIGAAALLLVKVNSAPIRELRRTG